MIMTRTTAGMMMNTIMNMNRNMDITRNTDINMNMKKNMNDLWWNHPLTWDSHRTPRKTRGNWASAPRPWKNERGGHRPSPRPHPSHSALGRKGVHRGYAAMLMLQKTCGSTGYPVTPTKTNEYPLKNDGTRRLFCFFWKCPLKRWHVNFRGVGLAPIVW